MTIDNDNLIESIIASLSRIDHIKSEDIPNIDLYMDQVTTFIEEHLAASKRYPDDKILTKTMINNYAKNDLLPPPIKKKYSKEHILMLIFIYYFKGILSITDIQSLLTPLADKYFNNANGINLESIYNEVFSLEANEIDKLTKDITEQFTRSKETFANAEPESRDYLTLFSFICMLSFDVYVKKQLIEKIIDQFPNNSGNNKNKKK